MVEKTEQQKAREAAIAELPQELRPILSLDSFHAWKVHPLTVAFRHYLKDFTEVLRADHLTRWEAGQQLDGDLEAEARGRIATLKEIAGLEYLHVAQFYGLELLPDPDTEEEGEQSNSNQTGNDGTEDHSESP